MNGILTDSSANLTSLVSVAETIAATEAGMSLFSQLQSGNHTVFAPSNAAFADVPESVSSNVTLLTQILSYHILQRSYIPNGVNLGPNHTIARTLLKGGSFELYGNQSQALVLERASNTTNGITVVQGPNREASGPIAAANLQVYVIEQVLDLPANITEVASSTAPSLTALLPADVLDVLLESRGFTVFAPTDTAIAAASGVLGLLNATTVTDVLLNHVVNGTIAYSSDLVKNSTNLYSAGGQKFSFVSNSSGLYVMSGNSTAKVVSSVCTFCHSLYLLFLSSVLLRSFTDAQDIIMENGVLHTIDAVLANTANNETAADSAFTSATAAATSMTPTNPVTATSQPAQSQGGSGSSTPSGAADRAMGFSNSMVGAAFGLVAAVVGGAFVLA